jgi:Zn finger protein HypA/HybF involved in hydrogenase expression
MDTNLPICPKCREYESARGFISCHSCNALVDYDEVIDGICPECGYPISDGNDDDIELLSFEDLEYDESEDDFDS